MGSSPRALTKEIKKLGQIRIELGSYLVRLSPAPPNEPAAESPRRPLIWGSRSHGRELPRAVLDASGFVGGTSAAGLALPPDWSSCRRLCRDRGRPCSGCPCRQFPHPGARAGAAHSSRSRAGRSRRTGSACSRARYEGGLFPGSLRRRPAWTAQRRAQNFPRRYYALIVLSLLTIFPRAKQTGGHSLASLAQPILGDNLDCDETGAWLSAPYRRRTLAEK